MNDARYTREIESRTAMSKAAFSKKKIWCGFDRESSLIFGNKMPTRCNRGFYCRSYCLLDMFRAPLCPSSGVEEYYTLVAACGISCCGFQVAVLVWSWGLCVVFAGCYFHKKKILFTSKLDLNFRKKLSKVLHLEHSFVWYWNLDTLESRSEIPGTFWNVVLEKDREDHVRNEVLQRVRKEGDILKAMKKMEWLLDWSHLL